MMSHKIMRSSVYLLMVLFLAIYSFSRADNLQKDCKLQILPPIPRSPLQWSFRQAFEKCGLDAQFTNAFVTFKLTPENRKALELMLQVLETRVEILSKNMCCASLMQDEGLHLMPYVRQDIQVDKDGFSVVLDFSSPFFASKDNFALMEHGHSINIGVPARPNIVLEDEAYEIQRSVLMRRDIQYILYDQQDIVRYKFKESLKKAQQNTPDSIYLHKEKDWTSVWLREKNDNVEDKTRNEKR